MVNNLKNCYDNYLKSNMDRFIVLSISTTDFPQRHLKSNMDRFIDFCADVAAFV